MAKAEYVLGTGLSHDGSAVLLKDGRVAVAIEKERVTRKKHDGGNDTDAVRYCLEAEGIGLEDLSLVVQSALFEQPRADFYRGPRLFGEAGVPVHNLSHHLAHAYGAVGCAPFDDCAVLIIDGCGSPRWHCQDLVDGCEVSPERQGGEMWCEKESFYHFEGGRLKPLRKEFGVIAAVPGNHAVKMPTITHSIGGFYAAVSHYCFGNLDDAGKLMGLAPYGRADRFDRPAFELRDDQVMMADGWNRALDRPADPLTSGIHADFQYYADVARWAQDGVERAVLYTVERRLERHPHSRLCYAGGVALNAVANGRILRECGVEALHMEPAAGDNGLALGCAFYGWTELLGRPWVPHDGSSCFGRPYSRDEIEQALERYRDRGFAIEHLADEAALTERTARLLVAGRVMGWFQGGSEFGPRALGRRSILAGPFAEGMRDHINLNIKRREDFRPFAPMVAEEELSRYFRHGHRSPYMILVDEVREEWRGRLENVSHVDGSARVQTVNRTGDPLLHALLRAFARESGAALLLNTSFNVRGQPMVERPEEALALLAETALDAVVLGEYLVEKPVTP